MALITAMAIAYNAAHQRIRTVEASGATPTEATQKALTKLLDEAGEERTWDSIEVTIR
jgi:hypothetical protein